MKKRYAIKDIAEKSGVSIGTVDRVIHNRGRVSERTKEKVNKVLRELNYSPNPIARSLKSNKVYRICALIPDPNKDSYWLPCKHGIEQLMNEFVSFDVEIFFEFYNPSLPISFVDQCNKLGKLDLDALVFVPLFEMESEQFIRKLKKQNVFVATFNSPPGIEVDQHVGQDLFLSGRVAAKLIKETIPELSKIAIIHIDETYNNALHMQEKENGFRDFFNEENNQNDILTITLKTEDVVKGLDNFLKNKGPVNAFFVTTSKGFEVALALKELGVKAKVVGYDLLLDNIECLKNGSIDFLIHQAPKLQASQSLRNIVERFLFKKEFPIQQLFPIEIINSENLKSY